MASTININTIPTGTTVSVTGLVDFSHIKTQIAGEELAAENARRTARGLIPSDKPYTRLNIKNCQVDYLDPNNPTDAEKAIAERFFVATKHPEKGQCYAPVNKSSVLPNVYVRSNAQSKQLERLVLENELAPDVPVTVNVRFYKTKLNTGISLDSVIVNEKPVRYYSSNSEAALTARGFTIVDNPDMDAQTAANRIDAQVIPEAPVPQAAPYIPPVAEAPVPQEAPTAQPAVNFVQPVPSAPVETTTATTTNVPSSSLPTPPAGYTYDENNRIVPISAVENAQPTGGITL